jgi:hypothetical protein
MDGGEGGAVEVELLGGDPGRVQVLVHYDGLLSGSLAGQGGGGGGGRCWVQSKGMRINASKEKNNANQTRRSNTKQGEVTPNKEK